MAISSGRDISIEATPVRPRQVTKTPIDCPVCGSNRYHVRFRDELGDLAAHVDYDFVPETQKVYQIVRCDDCGFIYTNPVPNLALAYSDNVDRVYLSSVEQRRRTATRNVARLMARNGGGHVLDIGCATGIFLDAAAAAGFTTEGIELSQWMREEAGRNHLVHVKPLSDLNWEERFDIITLWGVIEHLSDPAREMHLVFRALKPGGYVFIYTGNANSWLARIMGRRWYWYMGMHLMYFSRATLKRLLTRIGFVGIETEAHTTYFSLASLSISLRRYAVLTPLVRLLQHRWLANRVIALTLSGEMIMIARKPTTAP